MYGFATNYNPNLYIISGYVICFRQHFHAKQWLSIFEMANEKNQNAIVHLSLKKKYLFRNAFTK